MPPSRPPAELRCPNALHGILVDGLLEVKCQKSWCRPHPHAVVLHKFDPVTGELVRTEYYMDPSKESS
jgi:hypothetical protein